MYTLTMVQVTLLISQISIMNHPPGSTCEWRSLKDTDSLIAMKTPAFFLSELARNI